MGRRTGTGVTPKAVAFLAPHARPLPRPTRHRTLPSTTPWLGKWTLLTSPYAAKASSIGAASVPGSSPLTSTWRGGRASCQARQGGERAARTGRQQGYDIVSLLAPPRRGTAAPRGRPRAPPCSPRRGTLPPLSPPQRHAPGCSGRGSTAQGPPTSHTACDRREAAWLQRGRGWRPAERQVDVFFSLSAPLTSLSAPKERKKKGKLAAQVAFWPLCWQCRYLPPKRGRAVFFFLI